MDKKNTCQNLYNTFNMTWHKKKYKYDTDTWITKSNYHQKIQFKRQGDKVYKENGNPNVHHINHVSQHKLTYRFCKKLCLKNFPFNFYLKTLFEKYVTELYLKKFPFNFEEFEQRVQPYKEILLHNFCLKYKTGWLYYIFQDHFVL